MRALSWPKHKDKAGMCALRACGRLLWTWITKQSHFIAAHVRFTLRHWVVAEDSRLSSIYIGIAPYSERTKMMASLDRHGHVSNVSSFGFD